MYQLARQFAKEIFYLTWAFPSEEKYSLTDQVRRSSDHFHLILQKVGGKGFINSFKRHLVDSNGH